MKEDLRVEEKPLWKCSDGIDGTYNKDERTKDDLAIPHINQPPIDSTTLQCTHEDAPRLDAAIQDIVRRRTAEPGCDRTRSRRGIPRDPENKETGAYTSTSSGVVFIKNAGNAHDI